MRNLAGGRIWAATRLEITDVTIPLAGAIEACAFGGDAGPWGSVGAPELDQLFASRARISVPFGIKSEVGARKRPVHPGGLVEDGNVRCDLLLFDEPRQALGRTVGAVGGKIIRLQAEAILRPFDHGASRADFGLANSARGFDIASPIFVFALAIPMVRMNKPIRSFCSAKTCSTRERIFDLALLARRIASGIGRPFGLLRWTWLTKPFLSMNSSLAADL